MGWLWGLPVAAVLSHEAACKIMRVAKGLTNKTRFIYFEKIGSELLLSTTKSNNTPPHHTRKFAMYIF